MNTDKAVINMLERRPVIFCRRCSRELTHPDSYAAGIGPECSAHWGICQKELARLNMEMDPNQIAAAINDGPSIISLNSQGDRFVLRFKFDEDGSIRKQIKAITGWHFDFQGTRMWSVPATNVNLDKLMTILPQARIYIKNLERIKNLGKPQAGLPPRPRPIPPPIQPRKAWLDQQAVRISWDRKDGDFTNILTEIKECPVRKWDSEKYFWTALASVQLMELLEKWKFQISPELTAYFEQFKPKQVDKKLLYFSLCPLYNKIKKYGGWENAKRSLYQEAEQEEGRSNKEELREGSDARGQGKSERIINSECPGSRMERQSFQSDQRSNAQTGNQGKASQRTRTSKKETRSEFSGGQWTGDNRHHRISGQYANGAGIHQGICSKHQASQKILPECSSCLQDRLCRPNSNGCDRSGWVLSQEQGTKNQGCQKNQSLTSPWLDCPTLKSLRLAPPGLQLYRFQEEGLVFLESRNGRALIAWEMGLGKTIISLSWLRIHPEARPAVVVVPASLKLNWEREGRKWLSGEELIQVVSGRPNGDSQKLWGSIIIINYDILKDWASAIGMINPQAVILDESHYCKNSKALRTKAVQEICKKVPHVIAMSGTPIINRPIEFYNAINLVNPTVFPSWYKYASRYCAPKFNGFATEYTGASHTEELHHILTNEKTGIMIRRLKKDVLKDLPAKIRSVVPLELENRKEYDTAVDDFLGWLEKTEGKEAAERAAGAETLVSIGKLKQLAARGKIKAAISWIQDVVDQDEKIIVFAVHRWVVDELMSAFGKQAVRLTGKENQEQRQAAVDSFQNDNNIKVFVGNIKAAGIGITLTAASHVAFLEMDWTPAAHVQAEDRAHRIGQEATVNIYYLVGFDTIEEDIATMLDQKADVLGQVLDGKEAGKNTILGDLLKKMKKRKQP